MDTSAPCKFVRTKVGERIGELCKEKRLSQSKLSAMISMDRSHLNQLFGEKNNVISWEFDEETQAYLPSAVCEYPPVDYREVGRNG